jgi:LysW-gamma-L-lysine carboxypeptidase
MSRLLVDLVGCYSPSGEERGAVETLVAWMRANGFEAGIDASGSAVGWRGPADAPHTLMLLGHIDTYPGEIPVRVEDEILYGRGSVDAKGSLCAFAEAAAQAHIPAGWRVIVAGAVEEESASSKGARQIARDFQPDLCVIGEPSGAERITLGYKGRLLVDAWLTRANAHSARPEPGAAEIGVEFWNAISAWCDARNDGIERFFDQVMPSLRSISTRTDSFEETVTLTIGFRLPPRCTPDEVEAFVRSAAPEGMSLTFYGAEYACQGERTSPLARQLNAAIRAEGGQPGFVLKTGTSDMNVVGRVWNCPIAAYGPGDSNLDHTPNEHLPLAEYDRAVRTLRRLIETLPPG